MSESARAGGNEPLDIVYLHQYFVTPESGAGTRSYEMARRLVAAGHRVRMIASNPKRDGPAGCTTVDGIEVHWLPVPYNNGMSYLRRTLAFIQFSILASWTALRLPGDVVFATSTPLTIAIPALVARLRGARPMVFEVRDLWPELPIAIGALRNPLLIRLARLLETIAYRGSRAVVGLSPGMCDGVVAAGVPRDRVHLIPNSCDLEPFDVPAEQAAAVRAARPWLGERPLVLYAGTFGRINGVAWLAELAAAVRPIDPEVRFLVVGQGHDRELIERRANELGVLDSTFFLEPPVPKRDVPALFSAADVCCSLFLPLPEMEHNSANKFFDALAAARPVLINYGGWQADLVREHDIGLVVRQDDPDIAAIEVLDLLGDRDALRQRGVRARELGRERFSRDRLAQLLEDVLVDAARH